MAAQTTVPAADPLLFGHLIPLGSKQNDALPQKNSTYQILSLPGSFGRAELLEPYAKKKCSNCRHIEKEIEKEKNSAAVIGLCQFCQSIQSVAKFIPRKDFLNFSYRGGSKEQQHRQLVLTVARNTAKLVRVSSERPNYSNNKGSEKNTEDGVVRMVVNDGDLLSICWYQASDGGTSSKELKPLIQFRVFKRLEISDSISIKDDDVAVQKNPIEQASILGGDLHVSSGCSNESHLNTNHTHNKDQVGLINTRNEGAKSYNCNKNESQESSEEEEEEESAPLSLPSKFLASSSKSYSFDSQLLSASPSKVALHAATESCSTSQKRKTPPQMGDATSSSFTTTKTPKKSNVQTPNRVGRARATDKETAPLSSISYDELLQLRDQSTTSLRKNVLSLALALSSNASAYDSNFMKEVQDFRTPAKARKNQTGREGASKMNGDSKNGAGAKANPKQWIPRLLQGTKIILNKKSSTDRK
eukprot:scaffold2782_cov145-Skeletonema_menzelii.AAC.7